jgi:hypothetical protein
MSEEMGDAKKCIERAEKLLDAQLQLDTCKVKCPACGYVWESSLSSKAFLCMFCNGVITIERHIVVESETEVN